MSKVAVLVHLESEHFDCEHVQIHTLSGKEAISQLFWFDLGIVSLDGALTAAAMEGMDATIVFKTEDEEIRRVHGMIAEIEDMLDTEVETRSFKLRFVPRAHRLTLIQTQEIYMDLSVPEIIRQKLELVGLAADVELRLHGTYPQREFVVQYQETDLAFISRLAEHLGISFFFEHEDGRDKIVFTDYPKGFQPVSGRNVLPFRGRGEERDVFQMQARTRLIPKNYMLQDYNYRTPQVDLSASAQAAAGLAGGIVEQGAHFKTPDEGKALAEVRAEELQASHLVYSGRSDVCSFSAGARFSLREHPRLGDGATEFLLVSVEHRAAQAVATHGAGKEPDRYTNTFSAIAGSLSYRPPRTTPCPRIYGVATGIVEQLPGAPSDQQHAMIDEQGRYVVRFLFDTAPQGLRKASRPVRMAQPHAGPNYGMHFPLKPGIEVLLIFIDGDPDRPLIVGSVPNPITPSPVVQRNSVINRIKTASGVLIEMKDT
jgi:type VI secretion system secreted protein VgrG